MRRAVVNLLTAMSAFAFCAPVGGAAAQTPLNQTPPASAEAAAPLTAAERKTVVEQLAERLEARFVFPETGRKYAAMLRANLESGAYDSLSDALAFARRLTEDLQAVAPDRHLRVGLRPAGGPGPMRAPGSRNLRVTAIEHSGWIAPGVAYIRFGLFPGDPETVAAVRKFLLDHADARTLIIDARGHRGGGLAEMDAMLPLLYAAPATLVRMDTRADVERGRGPTEDGPTLVRREAPETLVRRDHLVLPEPQEKRLQDAQVYYLTSKRTASAAEHLALAFKRTKRAALVGETTAGAGHYGGVTPLGERFAAFIPVGRSYDPDTNQGWEAVGVAPDVAVSAERALERALQLAGVDPSAIGEAVAAAEPRS
ncbi:MAG: S41 family peptidase [Pseudomonadota bacterium]|nr:S41 family peptidase [Pseudomonadota bacterium]